MNGSTICLDLRNEYCSGGARLLADAVSAAPHQVRPTCSTIVYSYVNPDRQGSSQGKFLAKAESIPVYLTELTRQLLLPLPAAQQRPRAGARRRQTELAWLERHAAELRPLAGQWLAINGEELVSYGHTLAEVLEGARRRGVANPLLLRAPGPEPEISFGAFD